MESEGNNNPSFGKFSISSPITDFKIFDKSNYIIGSDCAVVYSNSIRNKGMAVPTAKRLIFQEYLSLKNIASVLTSSFVKYRNNCYSFFWFNNPDFRTSSWSCVGLSQRGANGMAQKGYDYKEILEHYYTGVTVE